MLDIGAGRTTFARRFRACNPWWKASIWCGEPHWRGAWRSVTGPGIYKMKASYDDFGVPDESLILITLNAFHVLMPPKGIAAELWRALCPGGMFISAHPVGLHPQLPDAQFVELAGPLGFTAGKEGVLWRYQTAQIGSVEWIRYPASPVIEQRFKWLSLPTDLRPNGASYVYGRSAARPTIRVWQKRR